MKKDEKKDISQLISCAIINEIVKFDEFSKLLENEGIDLVKDNDIDEYIIPTEEVDIEKFEEDEIDDFDEDDKEFTEFTLDIENDLKNKDIDEIASYSSSTTTDDPIKMYLREIGQIPLLSTNRELELARLVQEGIKANEYLDHCKANNIELSEEQLQRLQEAN